MVNDGLDSNKAKNEDKFCGCGSYSNSPLSPKGIEYILGDSEGEEPVSLSEFKEHSRIDFNHDDLLIQSYIIAARERIEDHCRISIVNRNVTLFASQLPANYTIDYGPLIESEIDFVGQFKLKNTEGHNKEIKMFCGYDNKVPVILKVAIMRYAAILYENREDSGELKDILNMVSKYKRPTF